MYNFLEFYLGREGRENESGELEGKMSDIDSFFWVSPRCDMRMQIFKQDVIMRPKDTYVRWCHIIMYYIFCRAMYR